MIIGLASLIEVKPIIFYIGVITDFSVKCCFNILELAAFGSNNLQLSVNVEGITICAFDLFKNLVNYTDFFNEDNHCLLIILIHVS